VIPGEIWRKKREEDTKRGVGQIHAWQREEVKENSAASFQYPFKKGGEHH